MTSGAVAGKSSRVGEASLFGGGEVHVGQDVGGREFRVAGDAVERYRAGTASDVDAGGLAPALVFHSECYRDLSWYLPNLIGNLHARQEWELFHPLRVGETVRSRTTVVERYRKRDRNYVVAEVLLTDADGRWLQRSRTHQSFLADTPADDLVVVQGMMSVCFVADLMTAAYGPGFLAGGKLDVRLVNVVWPGDAITARGKVREVAAEGSRRRAHVDVWCAKGDGTVTVVGTASALRHG